MQQKEGIKLNAAEQWLRKRYQFVTALISQTGGQLIGPAGQAEALRNGEQR